MTIDPAVLTAFHFTEGDLAANRAGKLSAAQRVRLTLIVFLTYLNCLPGSGVLLFMFMAALSGYITPGLMGSFSFLNWGLVFFLFIGVFVACTICAALLASVLIRLSAVQGNFGFRRGATLDQFKLQIDTHQFDLPRAAYEALSPFTGEFGAVYFIGSRRRKQIVSIDPGRAVDLDRVRLWGEERSPRRKRKKARSR